MVSTGKVMDNQRQQYIPPPPPLQQNANFSHLPPPPPRSVPPTQTQAPGLPPPPPGPHPSAFPPGTVFGIPGGRGQQWGPGTLPPPPPINKNTYPYSMPARQPSQLNIPPPPPQYDKPVLSATFIPTGDSFGPGVGIPPLEDFSSFSGYMTAEPSRSSSEQQYSDGTYNPHNFQNHSQTYPNPSQPNPEIANRETRATSASSKVPLFPTQRRDVTEPISPGPPTAQLINPQQSTETTSPGGGRQRAQSAAVGTSASFAAQWPLERVLAWLAANGFSKNWQETFQVLRLEGSEFLDLGRGHLGKMHQRVYPQLARVCSSSSIGWDQSREREEGKRLRKLISRLQEDAPGSAGSGHRKRESGQIASASTDGTMENSPHMTGAEFAGGSSPAKQYGPNALLPHNSQVRSSTMPVKPTSNPSDHRTLLSNIGNRGRHSPNLSGDGSTGLAPTIFEISPSSSPGLAHVQPSSAGSGHHRSDHSKSNSTDSMHKRNNLNIPGPSMSDNQVPTERFYEQQNRRDAQDGNRPPPLDALRAYSNDHIPNKDHSKGFLGKFMKKRHDQQIDEHSPTSPGFRQIFSKPSAMNSEPVLAPRPSSATAAEAGRPRRGTRTSRKFFFVTPDHWNYRLVDVTGVENPQKLRKLLCDELCIYSDIEYAQLYFTEAGQTAHESPLSDEVLMSAQSRADNSGNLKIYLQSAALSAPGTAANGLGMSFSQRVQGGQPMTKSMSAGGAEGAGPPSPETLQRASEEYRKLNEAKQRAYFESRLIRKESTRGVIDFDSPRASPFEEKKQEQLVPLRRPPTAPPASNTLTKVNSLRAKTGSGNRSSLEALKRISDPIAEEAAAGKRGGSSPSLAQGVGTALANVGKMAGAPVTSAHDDQRAMSTGGSPRPDYTWSKGNVLFKNPDYVDNAGDFGSDSQYRAQNAAVQNVRKYGHSPAVSPSTDGPRPQLHSRRSYGPDLEFKETNVQFAPSPRPLPTNGDDDDSDDGLFAIPLTNKSLPKGVERPTLTLDTDQHAKKSRVAFKTPSSSGGLSANRGDSTDESAHPDRSYSDGSFSGSARTPDGGLGRRASFHSDIWASRPTVENVVENLDEFFPGVDLDRPFMPEAAGNSASPAVDLRTRVTYGTEGLPLDFEHKNDSDTLGSDESTLKAKDQNAVASVAQRQVGRSGGLGRMKSIREVAQKRNVNGVTRAPSIRAPAANANASGIVRRKSTKMWGANIVQIKPKPGNRLSTLDPIPQEDVPTEDAPKRQATFKIIRGQLIGKGTYGRVYLGMNATTGEFLAVKQVEVNSKLAGQDKDRIKEMVAALDQEIETMKNLEHPSIVQYLGCERKEFSISIYLEYISGGSVGSCLRKHGKFEEPVVRSLTRQTLEGLAYLHAEGILHRDLKADNILLDLDGSCKISDFGISKKSDNIYGNDVTNSMQGSVFWMAPEVVRSQGVGYSAKIDIWSLGCVVLEMFAGKRPWSREEAIGAIFKLGNLNQAPPIPDDVEKEASIDGLNFMYNCFEINPHERPTAGSLLDNMPFCKKDPYYNFYDTALAAKLRNSGMMPLGE